MITSAGADAAVLARLWGALCREEIPGIGMACRDGEQLVLRLADGRELRGDGAAAQPFAVAPDGLTLTLGGQPVRAAGALVRGLGLGAHTARFAAELDDSAANLALARAAQPAPDRGYAYLSRAVSLADLEQCVVDGHPLHPLCRTRTGMSATEVRRYAPEYRPTVRLEYFSVPPERWHSTGAGLPPRLAVHPWQREHVLARYPFLRPTGEQLAASPLMSLRTLAPHNTPGLHLKTALDVQMTSAVRTVSPAAVHNGPVVSRLLAPLCRRVGIGLLDELAAGAVLVDGQPCRSLAVVHRRAPQVAAGERVLPLAALAAPSPASGRALLTELPDPLGAATSLVHLLLPALLRLLHLGVALEAHGQNTLVVLAHGQPVRLLYRDFGGIRLHAGLLARAGVTTPPLLGDLLTEEVPQLWTKTFAAAVSTVCAELAATLHRELGVAPGQFWDQVAAAARRVPGPATDALFGPTLPVKALVRMRLSDQPIDDQWTTLPNPVAAA
jgi:siderophore synthetase component